MPEVYFVSIPFLDIFISKQVVTFLLTVSNEKKHINKKSYTLRYTRCIQRETKGIA